MTTGIWEIVGYAVGLAVAMALGGAVGYYGKTKGYPFGLCFMLGVFTTPFVGWIIVALLPERENRYRPPAELLLAIELERARMAAQKSSAAN